LWADGYSRYLFLPHDCINSALRFDSRGIHDPMTIARESFEFRAFFLLLTAAKIHFAHEILAIN